MADRSHPLELLRQAADGRAATGLRRALVPRGPGHDLLDLASNDYLGLSGDERLIAGAVEAVRKWGPGSTGSRLVTGTTELHAELEGELAEFTGAQAALVFSSGYLANLTVITGAQVSKVAFRARVATGVEWIQNGQVFNAAAEREVVLSAGALQSPQLLQLSGVGPADLLQGFGIPVVADAPEVGRNLQDHYQARMIVRLKQRISLNDQVRSPSGLVKMGLQWLLTGSGPLSAGAGQVGGAACTEYAAGSRPDVQFNVMPLSVDKPGDPLHRYSGFTASVWQCHGQSRGHLAIRSTDPFDQPRIEPHYFAEEIDRKTIVAGLQILRDIYRQKSFRDLWDIEMVPGQAVSSPAGLWDFARTTGGTVFHCVGTCRMGSDDRSVLDPQLRVRGVERLRVIDASVMPLITSANTNASSLMIGERGAALVMS